MATCRTMRPSLKAELTAVQATKKRPSEQPELCLGWGWPNAHRRTELGARKPPHWLTFSEAGNAVSFLGRDCWI